MTRTVTKDDVDRMTIPDTAAGLEEMLADSSKMTALFAQPEGFKDFIRNYAKTILDHDMSIATQVKDETTRVLGAWLREQQESDGASPFNLNVNQEMLPLIHAEDSASAKFHAKMGLYNKRAMGNPINNVVEDAAEFFHLIWHNNNRSAADAAKIAKLRNAFSSTVPSEGGFLIPETLRSEMLRVSLENSVVRPRARVIPMDTLRVPFPAIDSTSNVSSVYGGIVGFWTEEGGQLQQSQAAFSRIVLEAKKLTAYTQVPNELLSDSLVSFAAFIDQVFPEALGFYEDDGFMNGSGVGMPLGFLNATAMIEVAKEVGQGAGTIHWENLIKMYARMLPGSLSRAVWIASIDTLPELATMALSVGTGGSAIWLSNGVNTPPISILGRPVIFTEKAPSVGNDGDINFVDLSYYLIGDRQVMSAMSSQHFKFDTDETVYRIIQRLDGTPWLRSAITPKNAGSTLSPFVQLAERT